MIRPLLRLARLLQAFTNRVCHRPYDAGVGQDPLSLGPGSRDPLRPLAARSLPSVQAGILRPCAGLLRRYGIRSSRRGRRFPCGEPRLFYAEPVTGETESGRSVVDRRARLSFRCRHGGSQTDLHCISPGSDPPRD